MGRIPVNKGGQTARIDFATVKRFSRKMWSVSVLLLSINLKGT